VSHHTTKEDTGLLTETEPAYAETHPMKIGIGLYKKPNKVANTLVHKSV
jgi:hypothetical protein